MAGICVHSIAAVLLQVLWVVHRYGPVVLAILSHNSCAKWSTVAGAVECGTERAGGLASLVTPPDCTYSSVSRCLL